MATQIILPRLGALLRSVITQAGFRNFIAGKGHDKDLDDLASESRPGSLFDLMTSIEDPLAQDYAKANERADAAARVARDCGDYPLLSGGDTNLNSLFVERAAAIAKPDGVVGMLVPSGIATEMVSQKFFERLMIKDSVRCVFDFFNKRENGELFFPDVYYRFKFCAFVFSPGGRSFGGCLCRMDCNSLS